MNNPLSPTVKEQISQARAKSAHMRSLNKKENDIIFHKNLIRKHQMLPKLTYWDACSQLDDYFNHIEKHDHKQTITITDHDNIQIYIPKRKSKKHY